LSPSTVAIDARLAAGTSTGDSSYWTGLLYGLSKLDLDLRFLLISNAVRPPGIPESPSFSWVHLPAKSSRWWSYVQFPIHARKLGADVIHTQYSLSPLVGHRGVTTIHDVSFFIGPEWFRPRDRMILSKTVPASVKRARRVIAVSNTCAGEIERYIPAAKGKTTAIYNGLPPWVQKVDNPKPALEKLGVGQPYMLTVGTQWPRKNMKLAIDAAREVEGYPLVVTGKAGWGEQAAGDHVKAVGYVSNEELCALYSGASLYLAPSLHEGFGIPVIEGFACGCPVLCSTGGALPEVAGDAAQVEPTWEPAHWTDSIRSLLADSSKLDELRRRGFERVKQFDWIESARQTVNVYREILA
jgi:glycosyltransferase involved in cell wall biosynthesis